MYGLTMSPNDIVDAFSKRNEAAATSIRDLANSCKCFIVDSFSCEFLFDILQKKTKKPLIDSKYHLIKCRIFLFLVIFPMAYKL